MLGAECLIPLRSLQGGAPEGVEFVDQEEEYVVDPVTGQGRWQAVGPGSQALSPTAAVRSPPAALHHAMVCVPQEVAGSGLACCSQLLMVVSVQAYARVALALQPVKMRKKPGPKSKKQKMAEAAAAAAAAAAEAANASDDGDPSASLHSAGAQPQGSYGGPSVEQI